jgi:DNA-binding winged helix-turn-helix (wHTH) protein/Tol biopolymer transport system component
MPARRFSYHLYLDTHPVETSCDTLLQTLRLRLLSGMPELPSEPSSQPRLIRFGPYCLDPRAGELRKHGIKIKLRHQTFQILQMLLENPGEVVLREEIRQRLWPNNTVVEFDHSINAAIQKLRDALGETAADPRYVETLPRRGYRFLGTVEVEASPVTPASLPEPPTKDERLETTRPIRSWFWVSVVITSCLLFGLGWARPWERRGVVQRLTLPLDVVGFATLSPDGTAVAYNRNIGLFMRRMDSPNEIPLYSRTKVIDKPIWSPDSSEVAFSADEGLMTMRVPNGPPVKIAETFGPPRGATWNAKGTILQAVIKAGRGGLYVVSASGGQQVQVEVPNLKEGRFFQPQFLTNGEDFIFGWSADGEPELGLYLATLHDGKIVRGPLLLRKNLTAARFSDSGGGRLLYLDDDRLYAQTLNTRLGRLEGDPQQVVDGVYSIPVTRIPHFSVSQNGMLVWRTGRAALAQLTWFDRQGKVLGTVGPPCDPNGLRLSPDERHIMFSMPNGRQAVIPSNSAQGHQALTVPAARWLTGNTIIYRVRGPDGSVLRRKNLADGTDIQLAQLKDMGGWRDVSSDGKTLLYDSGWSLSSFRIDGQPQHMKPRLVLGGEERIVQARLSPDGQWLVYVSLGSVYARRFESGGHRVEISNGSGRDPVWRADGKEILYRNGKKIYSVRVDASGTDLRLSTPEALFDVRPPEGLIGAGEPLAVTRDGLRILFAQAIEQPEERNYVMTNWEWKLKRSPGDN